MLFVPTKSTKSKNSTCRTSQVSILTCAPPRQLSTIKSQEVVVGVANSHRAVETSSHREMAFASVDGLVLLHWPRPQHSTLCVLPQPCWKDRWTSAEPREEYSVSSLLINLEPVTDYCRVGTACSFLAQLALTASVWLSYFQWLWRTMQNSQWTVRGLNKAFSVDTSPMSILSLEMFRKFTIGSVMAFFAW